MNPRDLRKAQDCASKAALAVGKLMREHQFSAKKIDFSSQHDIKLELDSRSQRLIESRLTAAFPKIAILGEEGVVGDENSKHRWVVDPIDGTVNFTYGIPHACVSIALQEQTESAKADYPDGYNTVLGVIYDPFCNELWTAIRGQTARMNGQPIHVSERRNLNEAIVSIGFAKSPENLQAMLPFFNKLVHRVRKIRMMGAAALALTYVASARFDAYVERGIRLWDIAAGGLILECAGGEFWHQAIPGEHAYKMIATNGLLRRTLRVPA